MKKPKSSDILTGIISVVFFAGFGILMFLLPDREMSELENRMLAGAPALSSESFFSGEWGEDFEEYLIDQFPAREFWVGTKAVTEAYALRKKDLNNIYLSEGDRLLAKTAAPDTVFERNLRALENIIGKSALPVTVMLPPTATTALEGMLPRNAPHYDERLTLDAVRERIGEDNLLDISAQLADPAKSEGMYFRTDHHWTMRGAYEAYSAYIASLGMSPLPPESFDSVVVTDGFHGTSYAKAGLWGTPPEPIEVLIPEGGYGATLDGGSMFLDEKLEVFDKYSYFLGGNLPTHVLENPDAGTGRTLVVIKDSYAHILAPMLSLHFDRVVLMDPRYINSDPYELMAQYDPTDLLVLFNADNMGHENGLTLFLRY